MNSRKRPAPEPLLPVHSPKQPRTTMADFDAENSSSEFPGLLYRWREIGGQFRVLLADTIHAVVHGARLKAGTSQASTLYPMSNSTVPMDSVHDTTANSPKPNGSNMSPDQMDSVLEKHHRQPKNEGEQGLQHAQDLYSHSQTTNAFHIMRSSPCNPPVAFEQSRLNTRSTHINECSSSQKLQQSRLGSRKSSAREHIFAKAHRANVKAETQKLIEKEKAQRELYSVSRSRGFTSNFRDFQSLLAYQVTLDKLEQKNVLSPSASMVDFRSLQTSQEGYTSNSGGLKTFLAYQETLDKLEQRRVLSPSASMVDLHSLQASPSQKIFLDSDSDDMAFIRRAFERAKATLNEPRPPLPFQPTLDQLRLSHRRKDQYIEQQLRPKVIPPTPLPPRDDAQIESLLRNRGVVAKFAREQVNDHDLSRLRPGQWLNDEIINFYGALILARSENSKENPSKTGLPLPSVYYLSTFFWAKLQEGYEKGRLAKWTKKVDIFTKDVILIPINHSNAHWTSAAINFRKKRIESFDSMGIPRPKVFKLLREYVDAEHRTKKKAPFDFKGWVDYSLEEPLQENGYDCGVFTCQFLQGLARGDEVVRFTQKDMPCLRRRMIWEIYHTTLRDDL